MPEKAMISFFSLLEWTNARTQTHGQQQTQKKEWWRETQRIVERKKKKKPEKSLQTDETNCINIDKFWHENYLFHLLIDSMQCSNRFVFGFTFHISQAARQTIYYVQFAYFIIGY